MTVTTRAPEDSAPAAALYLAFDLGHSRWALAFTTATHQPPRLRSIPARDVGRLWEEILAARQRFGVPGATSVVSCYEAGRDGFWLHRALTAQGITNVVVDAGSLEVARRARRVKTDRVDVQQLLGRLVRWHQGEPRVWSVVRIPSVAAEAMRQGPRELLTTKRDRARVTNRIKGLLVGYGVTLAPWPTAEPDWTTLTQWDGTPLPAEVQGRLGREWAKGALLTAQIQALATAQRVAGRTADTPAAAQVRRLVQVRGLGVTGAWLQVAEFFAWRQFRNRREVAALAGLTPTPFASGATAHEQGISKTGNRYIRTLAIELAWGWLRYQPTSELSLWYARRFGHGNSRLRRIGIVALARRLLIAVWRYLETDELPAGAVLKA